MGENYMQEFDGTDYANAMPIGERIKLFKVSRWLWLVAALTYAILIMNRINANQGASLSSDDTALLIMQFLNLAIFSAQFIAMQFFALPKLRRQENMLCEYFLSDLKHQLDEEQVLEKENKIENSNI